MLKNYNLFAGQNIDRIAALSDGLFAVAMTLLVLDLHVPLRETIHDDEALSQAMIHLAPRFAIYLMSFLTLGIFWVGQQTQLNHLQRSDRHLTWINLSFLFMISLMPFSTSLMAEFVGSRLAVIVYWFNILLLGSILLTAWCYANQKGLLKEHVTSDIILSVKQRILIAQSLYAVGAALCYFTPILSIIFIIIVQLNYALAPKFK